MDFMELAKARYSVRSFQQKQIEPDLLEAVLEAGRLAPTAVNWQPQRLLLIQSEEGREKIRACTKYDFGAPTIIVICYDSTEAWVNPFNRESFGRVDATLVIAQMMLEATARGLGTTFVGYFDPDKLRELFELPDFLKPVALLPIGYPAEDARPAGKHFKRKELKETVFYESFAGLQSARAAEGQNK